MYAVINNDSIYETRYYKKHEDAIASLKECFAEEIRLAESWGAEIVFSECDDKHFYILERNKYMESDADLNNRGYRTMTLFEARIDEFDLD